MNDQSRPLWQLPAGVSRGTWDYVTDQSIATLYDGFHDGHPLLQFDQNLIQDHLARMRPIWSDTNPVVVDFGCGTGRNLLPLAKNNWRVLGVDLSQSMLDQFSKKAQSETATTPLAERVGLIRANMVSLECLADQFANAVLCMYSSIGMIQGRVHRVGFMTHVARILKPGGLFFVHVHNRGSWLRDPGGIRKTVADWYRSKTDKQWELGDSIYPYRGLPSMFLHIFSESELKRDLKDSGLTVIDFIRLNRQSSDTLRGNYLPHLRAGGFIAVCQKK